MPHRQRREKEKCKMAVRTSRTEEREEVLQALQQIFPSSLWRGPRQSRGKVGEERSGKEKTPCIDPYPLPGVSCEAELGRWGKERWCL